MAAVAQHALGRPGLDRSPQERDDRMAQIISDGSKLVARLNNETPEDVGKFLALDVLAEVLQKRVGQVGRYERTVFFDAFKVLIEEHFNLSDMEPGWRAS